MYYQYTRIPEKYVGLIIGKKGKNIKKIEIKFQVKIVSNNNLFLIYSCSKKDNALKAKNNISEIIHKKYLEENECSICLEKIDMEKNFIVTECKHRFHFGCLQESLKNNNKCPICRETLIEKEDIERIIQKTILAVRRTNYAFYLGSYLQDIYSYPLIVEEFLREPLRHALSQVI